MSSSPSSSRNEPYDVYISFRGEDVRYNFLHYFRTALNRKSIKTFTDVERGKPLDSVFTHTIKDSRIAVVLFSKNYASSRWCLKELLEIVKCHKEFGQRLITIFHHVEPSDVKKQTGPFGKGFKKACEGKPEEMKNQWRKALTEVATLTGFHIKKRDDEARCIEDIVGNLLGTLMRTLSKDFKDTVGIEDHIAKLNLMLDLELESEKVRKVGIWGPSGIGKTTIARALYSQYSYKFDHSVFLDVSFITKSTKGNLDGYNMKLYLQENFLSKILDQKDIVGERLTDQKVLLILDDVENKVVLDILIGRDEWFGLESRIIVITKDKRLLEAHGIDHIYEVSFPSEMQALQIFCQSAFGQKSPHDGYMELATEVVALANGLPLGLSILGSTMKNRKVEDWKDELPMLRERLNGKIEGTLRLSYDRLDTDVEKAIFRHIACFFNGVETNSIMLMLPYEELMVKSGLYHLVEKSLISLKPSWNNTDIVDMHCLVQEMGKRLVSAQSNDPGEREFLFDSEDVCNVLKTKSGTGKVLGISLDINEIEYCRLSENAFKGMHNLRYLRFYTNSWEEKKEVEWNLPERFEDFPSKLKLLSWPGYPMEDMPSQFCPESLVELRMPNSKKLKGLWKGVKSLKHLKIMDLSECQNLTNVPDLSKAINLETLNLDGCSSLVELPSSIMSLNKLTDLNIAGCTKLEDKMTSSRELINKTAFEIIFPPQLRQENLVKLNLEDIEMFWEGVLSPPTNVKTIKLLGSENLKEIPDHSMATSLETLNLNNCSSLESLSCLNVDGCSQLKTFPDFSNKISELNINKTAFRIFPSQLRLDILVYIGMEHIMSERLWKGVQPLTNLKTIKLLGSANLKEIPDLSMATSLETLNLNNCSSLRELTLSSIQNLNKLTSLEMLGCSSLETLPTGINLKSLHRLNLNGCSRLTSFPDISRNISVLYLNQTAVEEVPPWIKNLSSLEDLEMRGCKKLKCISPRIFELENLDEVFFSDCEQLADVIWPEKAEDNTRTNFSVISFINCFNLNQETFIQRAVSKCLILPGEVPPYFTHRSTGNLIIIPLHRSSLSQKSSLEFKACVVVSNGSKTVRPGPCYIDIEVSCRFGDKHGNYSESAEQIDFCFLQQYNHQIIFDCHFPLNLECRQVEIKFHLPGKKHILKRCGVRLAGDSTPFLATQNEATESISLDKNKRVGPIKEENQHGKVSKSNTMVTYKRHMPQHQVFINFYRGEEDLLNFINTLISAFSREGVNVFIGKYDKKDDDLGKTFQCIENSNIALVIFSNTYTKSRRCLEELVKIKERMDEGRLIIIPISYRMETSQMKHLEGYFGHNLWKLWKIHRDHRIIKWMDAWQSIASKMDFFLKEHRSESEFVILIVEKVLSRILSLEGEIPSFMPSGRKKSTKLSTGKERKHETFPDKCPLFGLEQRLDLSDDCTPISANQNEASDKYESIADNDGGYITALREEECGDNSDDEDNKRVGPIKEENQLGKVSKSYTMVTYKRHMPQHQVFINFCRGEEVLHSPLVSAFSREGVNVFIGKYDKKDDDLGKTFQRIEDSNIALVIFSNKYTESRRCLEELVKIKERMDEGRLVIIPIFYKVEPSQVKHLEGDFGLKLWNLWRIHRDHRIIKWKDALESVASKVDFCLKEHRSESEFVTLIVEKVLSRILSLEGEIPSFISTSGREKNTKLSTGKGRKHETFPDKCPLFGLEQRMEQVEQKLKFDCNETRIIGVVGMAGIGKTTLAMMLHKKWNCKFVRCAPLLGIRKKSEDHRPAWLRKTLLEVLLGWKFPVINDKTTHKSLEDKLLKTKVFVVLDDVSNKKQLKFLLGDLKWIKKGSKIVITSRDKSLIKEFVHDTYVVPPLNYGEALQLFSYHASSDHVFHPTVTSMKSCREIVDSAGGNPLVIKLLGKQLHGRDKAQWEIRQGDLSHLGMVILSIFRISFDELTDKQKDVFLDIACFFRSDDDYLVKCLLDSGDHSATDTESEVRDLTHKCMIAISGSRVEMHDLMYIFGKIFSSQALIKENGGKSRLWYTQEVIDALINEKDTKSMRGIFLDMAEVTEGIELHRQTFIHMINLRYLKIYDSCFPRPCKSLCKLHIPDGLEFPLEMVRYLHWVNFPLDELPSDFKPETLVDLRLPYSKIKRVWEGVLDTPRLKWVDLSHSSKLLNLSALSKAESLQRLNLEGCTNLDELPREMQNMKSLVYLNMRGCVRLRSLPEMNLMSLKTLILSYCSNLKEFQVISKNIEVLHLDGTSIRGLPPSIENLQRLVVLNLKNCKMLECLPNCLGKLKVLEEIILSGCSRLKNLPHVRHSMKHVQILLFDETAAKEMPNISCFIGSQGQAYVDLLLQPSASYPSEWPRAFDGVYSLRRLCLSGNDFVSLQNDIGQLYNLTWLDVKQCKMLKSIPMLPPRLQYFDASGCDSLEKVANPLAVLVLTEQVHAMFNFSNCKKLDQDAHDSIISYTRRRSQLMLGALSRYNGGFTLEPLVGTCFPGWEVPEWFTHRGSGSVLQPKLSPHWCDNRFTGIALCAVILFPSYNEQRNCLSVNCDFEFEDKDESSIHFNCTVGGWNELSNTPQKMELSHVFIGYTSRLDIIKQGGYDDDICFCTKSSLEFHVTDGAEKVVGCKVIQYGFSLVYATDDKENISWDAKTAVIPKRVKNVPGEELSYGNSRRDDDMWYQSYSDPTHRLDDNFITESKSDATQNLRKSFGNKRFEFFKNPGGEITISSNHHNTPTENVEMSSLVGVELRLKQLEKVLYSTPGKTRIVGVNGMRGIGKTTLANILFEKRGCKFPRNFFLRVSKEYISEELKRTYLEELLEHTQNIREEPIDESLKDNPLQTKVFVVLDNVSDKKQLEFLLGNLNWIKKGSKIVVTTCDKSMAEGLAHETYVIPHLNKKEAFQVFIYHAFDGKICIPTETFLSLSRMFVDHAGGNPLALKSLGSELRGKDEAYWEDKLQVTKMQNVWRFWGFYADQLTKWHIDVLLDIAYFFRSGEEYFIRSLLDSGDPDSTDAVSEVRDLAEKFFITVCDGRVEMNDRHYMLCKVLDSPGGLRLWKDKNLLDELRKTKQLEANNDGRGIFFDMSKIIQSIALERTTFTNMRNLRYLKIYKSCCPRKDKSDCKLHFPDGLDFPLEEVRYFHWLKFPLDELPRDFRPENLVDLRLPYSKVKRLWKGVKDTPRLKWVDLSYSSELLNLSALSKAESLQRLNLEGCTNLDELPREMQNMKSLVYLNMRGCIRLRSLPKMNLISLKTLILSDCSNLKEFQVISKNIEVLHLDGTSITGLPPSIENLQRLVVLNLKNCKMLECLPNYLGKLKVLEEIILSGCSRLKNLPHVMHSMKHVQILLFDGAGVDEMPNISCFIGSQGQTAVDMSFQNFGSYNNPSEMLRGVNRVSSLRRLCLSGNDFVSLQNDIGKLYNLIWLDVKQCKKLKSIPMLPPRLQYFDAHGCDSLEKVANPLAYQGLTEQIHATYNFSNCNKLDQDATEAIICYTRWKSQLILDSLSRYNGGFTLEALIGTCFPGWEIPAWFSYRASGSLLEPKLPPHWCDSKFTGIALCAVVLFPAYQNQRNNLLVKCSYEFKNEDGSHGRFSCPVGGWSEPGETIESSHVFIGYASKLNIKKLREENEEGCIHTEASFEFQVTDGSKELIGCKVLKCGFSLVYESDDLQVNSGEHETTIEANQDLTSSTWIQDFFGYIFLAFSCVIVFAILDFCVIVFAPQYHMSFSDFCWPLLVRILFFIAFGLFLKHKT